MQDELNGFMISPYTVNCNKSQTDGKKIDFDSAIYASNHFVAVLGLCMTELHITNTIAYRLLWRVKLYSICEE